MGRRRKRRLASFAIFLAALMVLGACGEDGSSAPAVIVGATDDDGYRGVKLDKPYEMATTALEGPAGQRVVLADRNEPTLIFFGYTNCPDICNTVLSTIASALTRLDEPQRDQLETYFVTTDPPRDDAEAMAAYLDRFDPSFQGLGGPIEKVSAVAAPLHIDIQAGDKLPGGGYDVSHGTHIFLARDGQVDFLWTASTSPADLAADLSNILPG